MKTESETSALDKKMEQNRHGLICIVILVVGCLGGITVGFHAIESTLALSLVVIPTMTTLSLLLAVSPMRLIMSLAAVSVVVDLLILSYYMITG